jgi:sugar lactone lactonase YvrE
MVGRVSAYRLVRVAFLAALMLVVPSTASAATSYAISRFAGDGNACATSACGDGGAATEAQLDYPSGVAVDSAGNAYIADSADSEIRMVTPSGTISTVAGQRSLCTSPTATCGDGGPATSAQLNGPSGVAVDSSGNVYIADTNDNRVREVVAATGDIETIAGTGAHCASTTASCGDGGPATSAQLNGPSGVAVDSSGNVYIADTGDNRIREVVAATGDIETIAGTGVQCGTTQASCGDGGPAKSAELGGPYGVAVDSSGNVYIADTLDSEIRMVSASSGTITTIAGGGNPCGSPTSTCGDGGPATSAQLAGPRAVAVDASGDVYIADGNDERIRMVSASTGIITTIAGDGTACSSAPSCGDGGEATAAQLKTPTGVAVDAAGSVYIADRDDQEVRLLTPSASPTVVTEAATVSSSSANALGTVNPNGSPVINCQFDYGTTTSYGSSAPCSQSPGSGSSPVPVSATLSGLTANTTYHFRLEATNGVGTGYGQDDTFTTSTASSSGGGGSGSGGGSGGGGGSGSGGDSGGGTKACETLYTLNAQKAGLVLATEPPEIFSLPFGWALQPLAGIGLVGGGSATSSGNDVTLNGPSGNGDLSLATLTLDANGNTQPLLGGFNLSWDGLSVSGPGLPSLGTDDRTAELLGSYVSLPLLSVYADVLLDHNLGPFALGACATAGAQLAARLYLFQAAVYVAEKIAAGAVADASTDGLATPVVLAVLRNQVLKDASSFVEQLTKIAEDAKDTFNLTMSVAPPVSQLVSLILNAGVHYVAPYVHRALSYVLKAVGRWAGQQLGNALNGAGFVWGATLGHFLSAEPAAGFAGQQVRQLAISRRRLAAGRLRVAREPRARAQAVSIAAALLQYGRSRAMIRPLFTSSMLPKAGQLLSIAGGHLTRFGRALIELTGPGYAAQRLVATRGGTAAEVIILPRNMKPGRWTLGILDYSPSAHGAPVRIDGMSWIVRAPKRLKPKRRRRRRR